MFAGMVAIIFPKWLGIIPRALLSVKYGITSLDSAAAEVSAACCGVNLAVLGWSGVLLAPKSEIVA